MAPSKLEPTGSTSLNLGRSFRGRPLIRFTGAKAQMFGLRPGVTPPLGTGLTVAVTIILLVLPVWTKFCQNFGASFRVQMKNRTLAETVDRSQLFGGTAVWLTSAALMKTSEMGGGGDSGGG